MSKWNERLMPLLLVFAGIAAIGLAGLALRASYPTVTAWLPAGVAVGATLAYGLRVLPGVFLGIFALDAAWTGSIGPALPAAATGTAAAYLTYALRERFARFDTRLETVRDVSVLALAGAVSFGLATALLSAATFEPEHARRPAARHLQMPPHHVAPARAVHGDSPVAHGGDAGMGTGHAPPPSHASEAFGVLLDDALGILLVAPAIFLLRHRRSIGPQLRAENPLAALTVLLVLAGVTLSV